MKKFLTDLIARKRTDLANLSTASENATTADEVRSIHSQMSAIGNEIAQAEAKLAEIEANENSQRNNVPEDAQLRNAQVVATFAMSNGAPVARNSEEVDAHDTPEYRTAFMNFVCRNTPIPAEFRANEVTATGDAGVAIPTTYLNEIIRELDTYGNIYAKVRKTDIQGGIAIPVLTLKPEASWIGDGEASESQKLQAKESVTFSYFGVECKIAQTLFANVTTLSAFQALFVPLATEAIVKAVEIAIFHGNGETQPTGILNDARVKEANVITMSEEEFKSWAAWHTKVKSKMKKTHRTGDFVMNQGTFDGYIDGMVDANGQPIGRTNYGINGEENYRFMGKNVETVEDGCIPSWDDAEEGDVVAVFLKLSDYCINSNLKMVTVKWTDHDTNQIKNKCIMICDGKLIDANGVLIIKKGAAVQEV